MAPPKDKAELLQNMEQGRKAWDALIAQVTDEQMKTPNVDGEWSIKDIVAHITGYEQYAWAMLADQKSGEGRQTASLDAYYQTHLTLYHATHPDFPDQIQQVPPDKINELFVAAFRYKLPREVRAMEHEAYLNLLQGVQMFTDAELAQAFTPNGKNLLDILPNQCYTHYNLHMPAIKAFVERSKV